MLRVAVVVPAKGQILGRTLLDDGNAVAAPVVCLRDHT